MLLFQYISCCSLSFRRIESRTNHYMFQYISCCSLSHPKSWKKFKSKRFNTSHVVVYLSPRCQDNTRSLFQYISCCSLSDKDTVVKYILQRFNTSHVVVYLFCFSCFSGFFCVSIHLML